MPVVLEPMALRTPRGEGQDRIKSIQGLDGRLLIHAEYRGVLRRFEVKPDDVGRFLLKLWIRRQHVPLHAVWLADPLGPTPSPPTCGSHRAPSPTSECSSASIRRQVCDASIRESWPPYAASMSGACVRDDASTDRPSHPGQTVPTSAPRRHYCIPASLGWFGLSSPPPKPSAPSVHDAHHPNAAFAIENPRFQFPSLCRRDHETRGLEHSAW